MIWRYFLVALAWAAVTAAAPAPTQSQSQSPAQSQSQAQPQAGDQGPDGKPQPQRFGAQMDARLDAHEARLRAIRQAARAASTDDKALQAQQAQIADIKADLADALSTMTPRLENAQERLKELGPAPAAGQPPEAPDVAEARAKLVRMQKRLDDSSKRARLLSVEASQLSDSLAGRLRKNFSTRLWEHSRSALDPTLWGDFLTNLPGDVERVRTAVLTPSGRVAPAGAAAAVWSTVLAVLGLFLLAPGRLLLAALGRRAAVTWVPDTPLRKSALALWLTLVGALTPVIAARLIYSAVDGMVSLAPAVDDLAQVFFGALLYGATIDALGRSLLSPGRASWRLAPVADGLANRLAVFATIIGAAVGVASFLTRGGAVLGVSPSSVEAGRCLSVILQILAVGGALAWARRTTTVSQAAPEQAPARLPWVLAAIAAWLALVASVVAVLVGYVALANFVMRELIWVATVLATLFLLMRFVDDLCDALFAPRHGLSRLVGAATGLSDMALEQIGVLLSGALRLGLVIFGWMAIVAPIGASAREIFLRATSTEMVFKLGQISVSPGLIFGGVVVFAIGLMITRVVRSWVETTYLPKTRIDVGLRTSITAGLTYLGALIALLTACAYLGLSLSNVALFASALSVGIGFGLQAVIGNFVSGLILLAERPIKVGDRIALGDQEGDVRRINIRATEIEMGDRSKLIVPNSDLISKVVRNVTHGGALGQVKITLRVANDSDAAEVRALLLEQLTSHAGVLRDPAPGVFLTGVTNGGLDFTALATISSVRQAFAVKSELLFAMVAALKAHGVSLAPN